MLCEQHEGREKAKRLRQEGIKFYKKRLLVVEVVGEGDGCAEGQRDGGAEGHAAG